MSWNLSNFEKIMKCKQKTQVKTFWDENICPCVTALDTMAKIDIAGIIIGCVYF